MRLAGAAPGGVFALWGAPGSLQWRDLPFYGQMAANVKAALPGYAGQVHAGVCRVFEPGIQEEDHGEATPLLARLGPAGLETLDTLIMAGTAATRADAIRWSLDRIRERPAYLRLRELRCDADKLKNAF